MSAKFPRGGGRTFFSSKSTNSTVEKYVGVIVDIEKIQKVNVNREDASSVDIKVIF